MSADQSHAWAATLGGLTGEQIAVGLNALATTEDKQLQDWPPAAPQFRALCENRNPEAYGLPPLERAYAQAMRNTHVAQAADARWSHAALYHAAKACGYSNLQSLKRADGLKLFDKHYSAVCQRLARGEELEPAPIAALPAPLKKGSAAVANAALAALRSKLGGCARG